MSTEIKTVEADVPPFKFGDVVRHESGLVLNVNACVRVVAHSHLRWAVYDANGNRVWAKNCRIASPLDLPLRETSETLATTGVESDLCNNFEAARNDGNARDTTPAEYVPIEPWKPGDPMERHPAVVARQAICSTLGNYSPEAREFVLAKCTEVFGAGLKSAEFVSGHELEEISVRCMAIINTLRMSEGNSVDVLCDNPDGPPNNAVECNGDWTNWKTRRFEGDRLLTALESAFEAYKATKSDWEESPKARAVFGGGTAEGELPLRFTLTERQMTGVDDIPLWEEKPKPRQTLYVNAPVEFVKDADLEPEDDVFDFGEAVNKAAMAIGSKCDEYGVKFDPKWLSDIISAQVFPVADAMSNKLDSTECSHQDEEAAHQETLRMLAERDAELVRAAHVATSWKETAAKLCGLIGELRKERDGRKLAEVQS